MAASRGEFSSRFGFIMAAAGSAVGLGNIWGFPTQAASNGGAAFLLVYLVLAFSLAYPALMAELIIGRHAHANAVNALRLISNSGPVRTIGATTGVIGFIVASLILSFYAIVAGWMIAHFLASGAELLSLDGASQWLTEFGFGRNILFMVLFMALTIGIISEGVTAGIERWSARLMPLLLITLLALVLYVLTLDGAMDGLKVYLLPDFERALSPTLIISALGAAFFSLSLGVGTMLIYGSYINDNENLPVVGGLVTLVDICIAVVAGFLVLPAMYVAVFNGVEIFAADGALISGDTLIFTVLPELFTTMGMAGVVVSLVFFFPNEYRRTHLLNLDAGSTRRLHHRRTRSWPQESSVIDRHCDHGGQHRHPDELWPTVWPGHQHHYPIQPTTTGLYVLYLRGLGMAQG